jgi:hypothetical protein
MLYAMYPQVSICEAASQETTESYDLAELPEHQARRSSSSAGAQKADRGTYAVKLAYFGPVFNGWAWASGSQGTTQEAVQQALGSALGLAPGQQVCPAQQSLACTILDVPSYHVHSGGPQKGLLQAG